MSEKPLDDSRNFGFLLLIVGLPLILLFGTILTAALDRTHPRCEFDRNELGPIGAYGGQWYWEYYKCSDGTTRRQMVAGPRG